MAASRLRVQRGARACERLSAVEATDVLAPDGCRRAWTLELVVEGERVPPDVLRELGASDVSLVDATRQGSPAHVVVTAVA